MEWKKPPPPPPPLHMHTKKQQPANIVFKSTCSWWVFVLLEVNDLDPFLGHDDLNTRHTGNEVLHGNPIFHTHGDHAKLGTIAYRETGTRTMVALRDCDERHYVDIQYGCYKPAYFSSVKAPDMENRNWVPSTGNQPLVQNKSTIVTSKSTHICTFLNY